MRQESTVQRHSHNVTIHMPFSGQLVRVPVDDLATSDLAGTIVRDASYQFRNNDGRRFGNKQTRRVGFEITKARVEHDFSDNPTSSGVDCECYFATGAAFSVINSIRITLPARTIINSSVTQ